MRNGTIMRNNLKDSRFLALLISFFTGVYLLFECDFILPFYFRGSYRKKLDITSLVF